MSLRTLRFIRMTSAWMIFWEIVYYFIWHIGMELVLAVFGFVLFLIMNEIIIQKKKANDRFNNSSRGN